MTQGCSRDPSHLTGTTYTPGKVRKVQEDKGYMRYKHGVQEVLTMQGVQDGQGGRRGPRQYNMYP